MAGTADFFQKQDDAQSMTRVLVLWLFLAAAGTAAGVFAVVRAALIFLGIGSFTDRFLRGVPLSCGDVTASEFEAIFLDPLLFAAIVAAVFAWVFGRSFWVRARLGEEPGAKIAAQLGGREIGIGRRDLPEEQSVLVNVVQEMSLAAGVPAPRIFVLKERDGINAFAAGTGTGSAVLAVTQGALDKLARPELQALVAHAYSRIVNGDMRLGTNVAMWLAGLYSISAVGLMIFKAGTCIRYFLNNLGNPNRKASEDAKTLSSCGCILFFVFLVPMIFIALFGAGIWAAGFVGQAIAECVQHKISREREHLADAAAVQFTRNASSLVRALSCVGGNAEGGRISAVSAKEYSHLFFVESGKLFYDEKRSLAERIRRIDPGWNGKFLRLRKAAPDAAESEFADGSGAFPDAAQATAAGAAAAGGLFANAYFGNAEEDPQAAAAQTVLFCAQSAEDACALIFLLLVLGNGNTQHTVDEQAVILQLTMPAEIIERIEALQETVKALPQEQHIPAVLLAVPALRAFDADSRQHFCESLEAVASADGEISIYEACILVAVRGFLLGDEDSDAELSVDEVAPDIEFVLNIFLVLSGLPAEMRAKLFDDVLYAQPALPQNLHARENFEGEGFSAARTAFERLRRASAPVRAQSVEAARAIVAAAGEISAQERDLLCAFAFALNCPISV